MERTSSLRSSRRAASVSGAAAAPAPVAVVPISKRQRTAGKNANSASTTKSLPAGLHASALIGQRPYMEDTHGHHVAENALIFGVFDGHGGDVCSKFCAGRVCKDLADHSWLHRSTEKALHEVFTKLDQEFCDDQGASGAGSTATVGVLRHCDVASTFKLHLGFVGDSSAIIIRHDDSYEMLTSNHHGSREDERKRIEKLGGTVDFDEDDKVYRVGGVLAVTRALGDAYLKPYVSSTPELREVHVDPRDIVLVASDGLWDEVKPEDVIKSIREHGVEKGVKRLVDTAAKVGEDNVCAVALDVGKAVKTHFPDKSDQSKAVAATKSI